MSRLVQQLPQLETGINLLESQERTSFHRLALNHLLANPDEAYWVDSRNNSSTYALNQMAPEPEVLDRLRIARAFTAYQHYSLVEELIIQLDREVELVLMPFLTSLYEDDEVNQAEAMELLERVVELLQEQVEEHGLTVLVSMPDCQSQEIYGMVNQAAGNVIEAESTDSGISFDSEGFESKVYPVDGTLQTTWGYWRDILGQNRTAEERFRERVEAVGTY
ncbi:MAG: hypothetical protein ABEJ99_03275 [Candidatus Nanohaloarchaea archaeon]